MQLLCIVNISIMCEMFSDWQNLMLVAPIKIVMYVLLNYAKNCFVILLPLFVLALAT